jgi:hypothetical protein
MLLLAGIMSQTWSGSMVIFLYNIKVLSATSHLSNLLYTLKCSSRMDKKDIMLTVSSGELYKISDALSTHITVGKREVKTNTRFFTGRREKEASSVKFIEVSSLLSLVQFHLLDWSYSKISFILTSAYEILALDYGTR